MSTGAAPPPLQARSTEIETAHEGCPRVIVTRKGEGTDYSLVLEHEDGKDIARRNTKQVPPFQY
jgi:hypothetical protein